MCNFTSLECTNADEIILWVNEMNGTCEKNSSVNADGSISLNQFQEVTS